jgi:hypothetical protein
VGAPRPQAGSNGGRGSTVGVWMDMVSDQTSRS